MAGGGSRQHGQQVANGSQSSHAILCANSPPVLRCDGDQIAVGACGGGFNSDCPGEGTGQVIRLLDNFFLILQEAPSRWSSAAACLSSTTGLAR